MGRGSAVDAASLSGSGSGPELRDSCRPARAAATFFCPAVPPAGAGRIAGRLARHAGASGLALLLGAGVAVPQQAGGTLLTFGTTAGIVVDDNRSLDPDGEGTTLQGTARLDFALRYDTPLQSLAISGDAGLRAVSAPDDEDDLSSAFADPSLRFAYQRQARDARLSLNGSLRRTAIAFIEPFAIPGDPLLPDPPAPVVDPIDPDDPDAVPLPVVDDLDDPEEPDDPQVLDDLDDLDVRTGDGTRINYALGARLELRRRAPLGVTLSAGTSGRRYDDIGSAEFSDETRRNAGVALRFTLNPVTRANLALTYSDFDQDGAEEGLRQTYAVTAGVSRRLTAGTVSLSGTATSTEDGERYGLSVNRRLRLPLWTFTGRLGVTQTVDGDLSPSLGFGATRALPDGTVSASLDRSIRSGSDDEEREVTQISVDYSKALTPLASFGADLSYVQSDGTGGADSESFGSAGVSLSRTLTEDWSASLSLRHRVENDADTPTARGNTVSLNLRRRVSIRP